MSLKQTTSVLVAGAIGVVPPFVYANDKLRKNLEDIGKGVALLANASINATSTTTLTFSYSARIEDFTSGAKYDWPVVDHRPTQGEPPVGEPGAYVEVAPGR